MALYDEIPETYSYLIKELNKFNLAYLHLTGISKQIPEGYLEQLGEKFNGIVIFNGGYGFNLPGAENMVSSADRYLVSIGFPFVGNPDLIKRIRTGAKFNKVDDSTLYTPGEKGYWDYPTL